MDHASAFSRIDKFLFPAKVYTRAPAQTGERGGARGGVGGEGEEGGRAKSQGFRSIRNPGATRIAVMRVKRYTCVNRTSETR